ncbi:hypothetical protein GE09DRAFT_255304 [Coniochaeta sp. 2T2.1]|nr:hypothetical protein GE09DRAFT_255304 [Coniochaeta sp. 2T2.1]
MRGLLKAVLWLAPVSVLGRADDLGRRALTSVADVNVQADDTDLSFELSIIESNTNRVCGGETLSNHKPLPNLAIDGKPLLGDGEGTFTLDDGTSIFVRFAASCLDTDPRTGHKMLAMTIEKVNDKWTTGLRVTGAFRDVVPAWIVVDRAYAVSSVGYRPGKSVPQAAGSDMPWVPSVPDAPVETETPGMSEEDDMDDLREEPSMPDAHNDKYPDALDFELDVLESLIQQKGDLEEMIAFQEQRLAEEFGWSPRGGESECHGIKCLVENIVEKVTDAAVSLYEDIAGTEDMFEGPPGHGPRHGKGPWWRRPKHPKHGRPGKGKKPHCPGKGPHHGWPHHGNHTHGNHTFPHPPPWRRPHHRFPPHPPPFCRCPPPGPPHHGAPPPPPPGRPHHGRPPHDSPPLPPDRPHHGRPPHDGPPPPPGRPHHGGPPHDGPPPPPGYPQTHGIPPPPPPHHHPHGPPPPHLPLPLKLAAVFVLFLVALSLHRRCAARRQARRQRRAARKEFVKRLFFGGWFRRASSSSSSHEEVEKEAMLAGRERELEEEDTSMEEELASCRRAADVVSDLVAAEEGRAAVRQGHMVERVPHQQQQLRFVQYLDVEEVDETLPAYDERSDSSVADGLRYTPGSSAYTPSSVGGDELGDRKD